VSGLAMDRVNMFGETPVHMACKFGCEDILHVYCEHVDQSVLLQTADAGMAPLDYALLSKSCECINLLHSYGVESRLVNAIEKGSMEDVRRLITDGYPVNSCQKGGIAPLHAACSLLDVEMVKFLIAHGADIHRLSANGLGGLQFAVAAFAEIFERLKSELESELIDKRAFAKRSKERECRELLMIFLKEKCDLTQFLVEKQPFRLCRNHHIGKFLFRYWKRQEIGNRFLGFINSARLVMRSILKALDSSSRLENPLFGELRQMLVTIMFISERIEGSFTFDKSLHHPLYILTTIDVGRYAGLYKEQSKNLSDALKKSWLGYHRFLFLFPIRWFECVAKLFGKVKLFLMKEIDDVRLMLALAKGLKRRSEEAKVSEEPWPELHSKINIPSGTMLNRISISDTAVTDEFVKKPGCVFTCQSFMELRSFFGKDFAIPRSLPFRDRERVEVVLTEDSLLIGNNRACASFPFFLVLMKVSVNPNRVIVVSPAGSFKLTFDQDNVKFDILKIVSAYEALAKDNCEEGELGMQTNKLNIYRCLVAYVPNDMRAMLLRLMVVRAGRREECRDLCYGRIMESLALPPVYFNLKVREMSEDC
jgi:hypothetical protein